MTTAHKARDRQQRKNAEERNDGGASQSVDHPKHVANYSFSNFLSPEKLKKHSKSSVTFCR